DATNDNTGVEPRIVSVAGAVGVGTQSGSIAGAGMVGVNIIKSSTDAYLANSLVLEAANNPGVASLDVDSLDNSYIIAIGGGVGAAIGYNELGSNTSAYLDRTTVGINGAVSVTAHETATIAGADVGVGVTTGSGGLAGAGSVSVNKITNTIDAHIANGSIVNTGSGGSGTGTAADGSLDVSIAGGGGGARPGAGGGAAGGGKPLPNTPPAPLHRAPAFPPGAPAL